MSSTVKETSVYTQLRGKAEEHLQAGTAPGTGHWSMGVDALCLLHRLSSNPDSAEDALKLLHELQVHQVELDLQNEEILANERGLIDDLKLYQTLYESAPIGYFLVDIEGVVIQGNRVGAELFGLGQNELTAQRIDAFMTPDTRPSLLGLFQRVKESGRKNSCLTKTINGQKLHCMASLPPQGDCILLACCECPGTE